MEHKSDTSLPR